MKQYLDLLQTIKDEGTLKTPARENMPKTHSLFGYQFRHNLADGFPLLTTKKINFKHIVTELLWFLKGDVNIKFLVDNGVNIWNEDQEMFVNRNQWTEEGSLGYQYGYLWRNWGGDDIRWQPKPLFKRPNKDNVYDISVKGVGCIGKNNKKLSSKIRRKLYVTWTNMLARCYIPTHTSYPNYGGKGVFVDNRWLCFEYFVDDCINLLNWTNKKEDWRNYQLDKDLKGDGFKYSKDTCIWDNRSNNASNTSDRNTNYTFENIETGLQVSSNNLLNLGKKIGIDDLHKVVSQFTKGTIKKYKGWKLINKVTIAKKGVDQIKNLIEGLKNNPMSRRHIITAWNPSTLNHMALNACHCMVQFNCRPLTFEEKIEWAKKNIDTDYYENFYITELAMSDKCPKYYLDCQMYQRSADVLLGVPYNIASYALLTEILAKLCNMIPGEYIHTFGDVHIYENHLEQVDEQLKRKPTKLPKLDLGKDHWEKVSIDFIVEEAIKRDLLQIKIENYNPQPRIKGELSTGLLKTI